MEIDERLLSLERAPRSAWERERESDADGEREDVVAVEDGERAAKHPGKQRDRGAREGDRRAPLEGLTAPRPARRRDRTQPGGRDRRDAVIRPGEKALEGVRLREPVETERGVCEQRRADVPGESRHPEQAEAARTAVSNVSPTSARTDATRGRWTTNAQVSSRHSCPSAIRRGLDAIATTDSDRVQTATVTPQTTANHEHSASLAAPDGASAPPRSSSVGNRARVPGKTIAAQCAAAHVRPPL